MMLGNFAADLAMNPLRVEAVLEPFKARVVVGEMLVEVADGVLSHGRYLPFGDSVP